MNKQLILPVSILFGCIILGGFIYASQINKQGVTEQQVLIKADEYTNQIEDDYFQKKVECKKYENEISKKIAQYNIAQEPEFRDSNNLGGEPIDNLYVERNILKELFYSPRVDSCLYVESRQTLAKLGLDAKPDVGNWSIIYETYYLIDALTGKEINFNDGTPFLQIVHRGEIFHSQDRADAIIDEYK